MSQSVSLRYGVMGLLATQPLHGYEVKSRFESMLGGTWNVNIGQVYTTLQRLERDGLVQAVGQRGDRGKLVYELSEKGHRELAAWLAEPDSGPQQLRQEVYVKLLLAAQSANGGLPRLLARQKRAYLQRLKDLSGLEERARRDGKDDLALLLKGALLHTEADLKLVNEWMEELEMRRTDGDG
jgi:DNA-binding PadR family transcriptional regulator